MALIRRTKKDADTGPAQAVRRLVSHSVPEESAVTVSHDPREITTVGRIPVLDIWPVLADGRAAKGTEGERLPVRATVFRDGHDACAAEVVLTDPNGVEVQRVRMTPVADPAAVQRFEGFVVPDRPGPWTFSVVAWADPWETWKHRAEVKVPVGIDVELELEEGARVLESAALALPPGANAGALTSAIAGLRDTGRPAQARLATALADDVIAAMTARPVRELLSTYGPYPIRVDRRLALTGAWYEFFPRSEGASVDESGRWVSGTFTQAATRLPAVAAMGFDVVYLPPIHPIGVAFRKGPNNTLTPNQAHGDPGSPWAIGSSEGGHDAIHPDLGTFADFDAFVAKAAALDLEVALDLALQCSPDHPWVAAHPEWFTARADGSIAYAENPPKKYQDIYPINFDRDPEGIFREVLRVVLLWVSHGVRIFRVDNPHTKPVSFWERLIAAVNDQDPGVIFLAEAFTKPPMMRILGEVGFQQSYTYFTWRNGVGELREYVEELAGPASAYMRPNFFANTPDILPEYLQYGGPAAFAIRATLAATLAPTYGIYSGFELFEHVAVRPGSEEYLDSEKYQYRPRDWAGADESGTTLAPYLTKLNRWRRDHPALQQLRDVTFHHSDDESVIVFSKREGDDIVLVVCATDPHSTRETNLWLNMPALGLDWNDTFAARDLVTGETWAWGQHVWVRIDPKVHCAHIVTIGSTS